MSSVVMATAANNARVMSTLPTNADEATALIAGATESAPVQCDLHILPCASDCTCKDPTTGPYAHLHIEFRLQFPDQPGVRLTEPEPTAICCTDATHQVEAVAVDTLGPVRFAVESLPWRRNADGTGAPESSPPPPSAPSSSRPQSDEECVDPEWIRAAHVLLNIGKKADSMVFRLPTLDKTKAKPAPSPPLLMTTRSRSRRMMVDTLRDVVGGA